MVRMKSPDECSCGTCPGSEKPYSPSGEVVFGGWVCSCLCHSRKVTTDSAPNNEGLKPCPFCKSLPVYRGWVKCSNDECGASGPTYSDHDIAFEKWNTRPLEDRLSKEISSLKEQLEEERFNVKVLRSLNLGGVEVRDDTLKLAAGWKAKFEAARMLLLENIDSFDRFDERGKYFSSSVDGVIAKVDKEIEKRLAEKCTE